MKNFFFCLGISIALFVGISFSRAAEPLKQSFVTGSSYPSITAVNYIPFSMNATPNANAFFNAATSSMVAIGGTFAGGYCNVTTAPGVGASWVFSYMYNKATTTATCTIANTATSGTISGSFSVQPGGTLQLAIAAVGTPTIPVNAQSVVDFQPNNYNNFMYSGHSLSSNTTLTIGGGLSSMSGSAGGTLTTTNSTSTIATPGVFDWLYVGANTAPGAAKTRNIYLAKNSATTTLTAGVTGASGVASMAAADTSDSISVAVNDGVQIIAKPLGTPAGSSLPGYSMRFVPTVVGDAMYFTSTGNQADSASATTYFPAYGENATTTSEANAQTMDTKKTYKGMIAAVQVAAASGRTRTLTLRVNGASTPITCTIAALANYCSILSGANVTIKDGDLVDVMSVPSGSPAATRVSVTLLYTKIDTPSRAQFNFFGGRSIFR